MAMMNPKFQINGGTFLKAWLYSAFLVLALLAAHASGLLGGSGPSRTVGNLLDSRARRLSALIEDGIAADAARSLAAWTADGLRNPERTRILMEAWLGKSPRVISAEYWKTGGSETIRVVNEALLRQLDADSPDSSDQRKLREFLRPGAFPRATRIQSAQFHSFLERVPFERSLLRLVVPPASEEDSGVFLVTLQIVNPAPFLAGRLDPGEEVTVQANGKKWNILTNALTEASGPAKRTQSVGASVPFGMLPWEINLSVRIPDSYRSGDMRRLWLNACIGLALSLILAYALTRWTDRPFDRLMETAVEIGRGNFGIRVPMHNNRSMNRLAKLINYMATEMDHLQKMNVHAIINEKNKTEIILRNIADGILVLDAEGRIMLVNATAEKWLRIEEAGVLQKPFRECLRSKPLVALIQGALKDSPSASSEMILKQADSRQDRLIQATATRVTNREGRTIGTVTVLRDVTKEREADRIKTELVSMVAHEIKSPLTSIYGFSELLIESELQNKKSAEYARVIQAEASRLTDFVNKFLSLSRLESGKIKIKMDPFDLRPVIEKTVSVFEAQAEQKAILIVIQAPDALPLVVGDQDLVDQVLVNLVSNAIKYSPRQSKIGIELSVGPKEVWVNIIDNGYGIPRESLPKIFDKFYRVSDSGIEEETEGSGLGLALAKEIIEKHGGYIKVKSKLGVGSVFTFSLLKAGITVKPAASA
jgi:two-component system, OmpR family, phosphate regulon sensor histidine kinase PhoR